MVETKCKQDSAYPETSAIHFESSFVRRALPFDEDGLKLVVRLRPFPKFLAVEDKPTHQSSATSKWWSCTGELATSSNPLTVYQILKFCLLAMQSHCSIPGSKIVLTKQLALEIRQAVMKASPPLGQILLKLALEMCLVVFTNSEVVFSFSARNYLSMDVMTSSLSHRIVVNIYTIPPARHQCKPPTHTMSKIANSLPTTGVTSLPKLRLLPTYNTDKRKSQSILSSPTEQQKSSLSLSEKRNHTQDFFFLETEEKFHQLKPKLVIKGSKTEFIDTEGTATAAQSNSNTVVSLGSKKLVQCEVTKMHDLRRSNSSSRTIPSTSLQSQNKLNADQHLIQPNRSNSVYDVPPSPVPSLIKLCRDVFAIAFSVAIPDQLWDAFYDIYPCFTSTILHSLMAHILQKRRHQVLTENCWSDLVSGSECMNVSEFVRILCTMEHSERDIEEPAINADLFVAVFDTYKKIINAGEREVYVVHSTVPLSSLDFEYQFNTCLEEDNSGLDVTVNYDLRLYKEEKHPTYWCPLPISKRNMFKQVMPMCLQFCTGWKWLLEFKQHSNILQEQKL